MGVKLHWRLLGQISLALTGQPLHNNPAELGARHRVRKRDVSFGPRSHAGLTAWDIFGTITQTATKLGVNVAHYLHDRLSCADQMPSLILQRYLSSEAVLMT